jgi:hypothetical protein
MKMLWPSERGEAEHSRGTSNGMASVREEIVRLKPGLLGIEDHM